MRPDSAYLRRRVIHRHLPSYSEVVAFSCRVHLRNAVSGGRLGSCIRNAVAGGRLIMYVVVLGALSWIQFAFLDQSCSTIFQYDFVHATPALGDK